MKLIFCTKCYDVISLTRAENRTCFCKRSSGQYTDSRNAVIKGPCVAIGFNNASLLEAVRNQPEGGRGKEFIAFVIPRDCASVQHEED